VNFRIDAADALVHVHAAGPLDRYTRPAAVRLLPERWFGQVIWQCIPDDEVRAVLVALVARARSGRTVRLRTRSASPTLPWSLAMEIAPLPRGGVEFRCRLGEPLMNPTRPSRLDRLRLCAWCYRADCGGWRELEEVVTSEHLLERATFPIVTHGICDTCLAKAMARLDGAAT
jgi:hypothetical protein